MRDLTQLLQGAPERLGAGFETLVVSLALSFVLGQLVAWVYVRTHSGLSYSRNFTQSLVLLALVATLVVFVIGGSLFTAFGLLGALAIIRFRNVLKDTRDTTFVFLALVLGMAAGAQRHAVALAGVPLVLAVIVLMRVTAFGARSSNDAVLTCLLRQGATDHPGFAAVLTRFCRRAREVSIRNAGESSEVVYALALRDRRRQYELVEALRTVGGVTQVELLPPQESLEP